MSHGAELSDYRQSSCEQSLAQVQKYDRQVAGALTAEDLTKLLTYLGNWEYTKEGNLQRIWQFDDFQTAFDWLNRAGSVCAKIGHNAVFTLSLGHGLAKTTIRTTVLLGLSRADGELAARLEIEAQGQTPWKVISLA